MLIDPDISWGGWDLGSVCSNCQTSITTAKEDITIKATPQINIMPQSTPREDAIRDIKVSTTQDLKNENIPPTHIFSSVTKTHLSVSELIESLLPEMHRYLAGSTTDCRQ